MMTVLVVSLIIVVLVALLFLFLRAETKNDDVPPKVIWTYWNEDPVPEFINMCIETWRKENPEYTVNIVNDKNLESFVGLDEAQAIKNWKYNDSPQRMSDLVRLSILSAYGGTWLDASIICYESLDWAFKEPKCQVYSIPELSTEEDPLIESWFISCKPEDPFVTLWNKEFRSVENFDTIDDYVKEADVSMRGIDFPNYLLVYVCAKKVYRELGSSSVKILNATEGPYSYHMRGGVSSLCERRPAKLIKFRKEDRAAMDDQTRTCAFDKNVSTD